jgi:hypothetical protein
MQAAGEAGVLGLTLSSQEASLLLMGSKGRKKQPPTLA